MTKFDRLAFMAAILCVANESSKKGSGVSDYDLEHATTQALMLHSRLEERLGQSKSPVVPVQGAAEDPADLPEMIARHRARHAVSVMASKGESTEGMEEAAYRLFLALGQQK